MILKSKKSPVAEQFLYYFAQKKKKNSHFNATWMMFFSFLEPLVKINEILKAI